MPPEALAQKAQKWTQLQNRRYAEKRRQGFIDAGKQVNIL
jgi:pre-mRNA-processing factor 8